MREVWLTARYEIRTTLARRSFWLTTFLLPVVVLLLVFVPQIFAGGSEGTSGVIPDQDSETETIGYVDPAGLLRTAPTGLPADLVHAYEDEAGAQAALASAEIDCYYLISPDYLESGQLTVVQDHYQPLHALDGTDLMAYVINTGITGNEALARLLLDPTPSSESRSLAPTGSAVSNDPETAYLLPYLLMFVLYMALAMTSGFMLQSVSREKENRTAEVLLVSLKPRDLMFGKIAGLSTVGLIQVAVWLTVIFGVFLSQDTIAGIDFALSGEVAVRVIPWTFVYFLLGYLMYASIYSVLGVLSPTARDANQFVFVAIVPLVIPLLFVTTFTEVPDGALATTLSLFPLTSPVAMVARLGAGSVPWWQLAVGAAALAILAYLFVLLAGRLFRANNLLSNRGLTWTRLKTELLPRIAGLTRIAGLPRTTGSNTQEPTKHAHTGSAATGSASGGPGPRGATRWPAVSLSKQRIYLLGLIAAVMLILGVREYLRGDSDGIYIAIMGVLVGGFAYFQYRRR